MAEAAAGDPRYGEWVSPVSAREVATRMWRPAWVGFVGSELWWTAPTPAQGGRVRLLRESAAAHDVLPQPWSVRTGFMEYGGRPFAGYVGPNGPAVVFIEWADQRMYVLEPDSGHPEPRPLTPEPPRPSGIRYADPQIVAERGEVWCVREEFRSAEPTDVSRAIVAVPLDGSGKVRVLIDGEHDHHFLANPRRSPDGRRLCWIGWDHPDMPWDAAVLCVAELDESGVPGEVRAIAGGDGVAIAQAEWLDAETLVYSSDATGWWNLYTAHWDGAGARRVHANSSTAAADAADAAAASAEEEFGGALWSPGLSWFTVLSDGRHVAAIHGHTVESLSVYDVAGLEPARHIEAPYTYWVATLAADPAGGRLATQAASPGTPYGIVTVDTGSGLVHVVAGADDPFAADWAPEAKNVTIRGADGREIHANVYLPRNPDHGVGAAQHAAAQGEGRKPPPFIVFVHGGPTGGAPLVYDPEIVYFTSRGLGVVDVNYGGSTGHGRAYRERLRGQWGVVDVEDCAAVVAALVAEGTADGSRIAIRGGSAGGWTTACALAADPDGALYRCGTIRFPVLDPVAWRTGGTHDLESQYLEGLVGPWPAAAERYHEVSPLERSDRITVPFVLLQGLEDAVCPPEQTRVLLDRVAARAAANGLRAAFAYRAFAGEQHGFRRASTIVAALEAELSLYGQAMGFDPPGVPKLELDA